MNPFSQSTPAMLPTAIEDVAVSESNLSRMEENSGTLTGGSSWSVHLAHETPAGTAGKAETGKAESGNPEPELSQFQLSALSSQLLPRDEWRIAEANRRHEILQAFDALLARGLSKAKAVKQLGESYVSIWRWKKRFEARGYNGLIPDTDRCGRKTVFEKLGITQEQIQQIINEVQGINLDVKSVTGALRLFANSDRCPADLAKIILDPNRCSKHAIPPSLRSAAKLPESTRLAHEGPRALSLGGIYTPRKMDVLPGDIFSADDTTPIWAWWVPWYESEEYPFGVKLLQGQFIPVIDVASQCCITYVIIAREKSSYRAADIWRLFGHTFDQVGLPRLGWQLERGSWEANVIRGQEVAYQDGEISYSRRVGGLRQLPTNVSETRRAADERLKNYPATLQTITSYLPKTKSIEAWFNRSQNLEATLWGSLGRDQMRQPFERAKKKFQQCQRGAADPREHFLSYSELCSRLNGLIGYLNREPMEGEVFYGVPEQRFAQAIAADPLFQSPAELRYLYARDWAVVTITNGWARVRLTDPIEGRRYSLFYCNPTVFAGKEGEQVAIYYDRDNFEQPAQIILARTGEYLCQAEYADRKGSFLDGDCSGHDMRKLWRNAVMSAYGTLVKHAPSRQLPEEIAARRTGSADVLVGETPTPAGRMPALPVQDGRPAPLATRPSPIFGITPPTEEQRIARRNSLRAEAQLAREINFE